VVALTKCDLADPSWTAMVEEEVRALVAGSFLDGAAVVRTSSATGEGVGALRGALTDLCATAPARNDPGLFRMAIDRAFTSAGHGTVVTGTVASGSVAVGDELEWLPEGRSVRVRGLQRHDRAAERIGRGSRAAINLAGVHHTEIRRGQELAAPGYLAPTRVLTVQLGAGADLPRPVRHRARYRLHLGTAEVTATLAMLGGNELRAGESAVAQFLLSEPLTAVSGQPFVLREESPPATLGGGRVLHPGARRVRRRDREAVDRLARFGSADPAVRASAALHAFGLKPWTDRALCREAGLGVDELPGVIESLKASGALLELPAGPRRSVRLLTEFVADLEDRVVRALGRLHAARPRHSAIPRAHLSAELPDLHNDTLVTALVERLSGQGKVVCDARTVALKGYEPKLSQAERRLKSETAEAVRAGGFSPPDLADLTASAGARASVLPELIALLRDEEQIVEISPTLFLDFETAGELRRKVIGALGGGQTLTMAGLRDLLGTTRKYAVPIGEYLDRTGLTLRDGDARRLNPDAPAAGPEPEQEPTPT